MSFEERVAKAKDSRTDYLKELTEERLKLQEIPEEEQTFLRLTEWNELPPDGDLFGLRFAVKDVFEVTEYPTSFGVDPPVIAHGTKDSAILCFLKERGAHLVGFTRLDEACLSSTGTNTFYGDVTNPIYSDRSPLGSSSGSAAAVARGQVDFSLGTDFGGSVRLPAAACGVCGLKMSPNSLPQTGAGLIHSLQDSIGIFTKELSDLAFLAKFLLPVAEEPLSEISSILVPHPEDLLHLSPDWNDGWKQVVSQVKEQDILVEELSSPHFSRATQLRKQIAPDIILNWLDQCNFNVELLGDTPKALKLQSEAISPDQKMKCAAELEELKSQTQEILSDRALILSPTLEERPPLRGETPASTTFMALANLAELPGLTFPTSMPGFSIQLLGTPGSENTTISYAQKLLK